jgi:hypothetical protein
MSTTSNIIQLIESPLHDPINMPVLYPVQAGDTLSQIITQYYDITYHDPRYKAAEASVVYFNEALTNPDKIYAGQLLRLMPLPNHSEVLACEIPNDFNPYELPATLSRHRLEPMGVNYTRSLEQHIPTNPAEQKAFWTMAWWDYAYPTLSHGAGAGFIATGGVVGQSNTMLLNNVKVLYEQYQRGFISKGQYDYGRQKLLTQYKSLVGPLEKVLFKGQTTQEAMRITRYKALPATINFQNYAQKMGRLAKSATSGGVILSAASLGIGCYQIATSDDQHEKNEIFVETVSSTIFGGLAGFGVSILLFSNPVGWTIAIAAGVGVAASSIGVGKLAKSFYNAKGDSVDLVKEWGVDKVCN